MANSKFVDAYITPECVDVTSDVDAVNKIIDLRLNSIGAPDYDIQVFLYDTTTGQFDIDISQYVLSDQGGTVKWDSTAPIPDSVTFNLAYDLQWGSDVVMIYALVRNLWYNRKRVYNDDTWIRFPMGQFIVTTPGYSDMDVSDYRSVTGYGRNYLLQTAPQDSYSFNVGSKYLDAVTTIFQAAGVLASGAALNTICDYPGDWSTKTLAQPLNYALGSTNFFLTIVNELLAASGVRNIYTQPDSGRWMIETMPIYTAQSPRWTFAGDDDPRAKDSDLDTKTVVMHSQQYNGDVYNIPNRWIFIQNGLTFAPKLSQYPDVPSDPAGGAGWYQVDNDTSQPVTQQIDPATGNPNPRWILKKYVAQSPSDQTTVARVIPEVVMLNASGQTDLATQGDQYVADALSAVETITINTTPWPVGRYFDIFYFIHSSLPYDSIRRCQAQSWEYELFGGDMVWNTRAVSVI
jgi:hypothetical protein